MKHILSIIAVGGALLLSGCGDDFMNQYPSNSVTENNFYRTDNDFNQAVYGCYYKLKTNSGFLITELAYRSDEAELTAMAVSTQDRYDIDHFDERPNNGLTSDVWNAWYNGIYRCNDVLQHMEGKSLENGDKYRGECLFLRSWYYFCLYRTFGVVPLTRVTVRPAEAQNIPRCTEEEIYTLLSEDLAEAASLLPDKKSAEVARVTSCSAWALLGKVELTFKHPDKAKAALEKAMANTNYGLETTTARAFDVTNKMNKEIIFALYYNKSTDNGHGYWFGSITNVHKDIRNPTQLLRDSYDDADNRKTLVNDYIEVTKNKLYVLPKWYDTYDATYTTVVGNDFPLLRYADVVLMYAEALADSNLSEAIAWLNKTRTRAGLPELTTADVPSRQVFIQELAKERGREFALEGQRWFDLVRLGLAVDYFRSLGYSIDEHNLVFPIPQSQIEIVNNPSILWQNPGFN